MKWKAAAVFQYKRKDSVCVSTVSTNRLQNEKLYMCFNCFCCSVNWSLKLLLFQLCLQLFQLYPELRHQGWFQLHQLISKDAVTTCSGSPKAPLASIVSGILGVLTQKVCVINKRFYDGSVYVESACRFIVYFFIHYRLDHGSKILCFVHPFFFFFFFFNLWLVFCPLTFLGWLGIKYWESANHCP